MDSPRGNLGDQRSPRKDNRVKHTPSRNLGEGRTQFRPPVEARVNKIMQSYGNIWPQREPGCQRSPRMATELPNPQRNLGYPFPHDRGTIEWRRIITTEAAITTKWVVIESADETTQPPIHCQWSWCAGPGPDGKPVIKPSEGKLDYN